MHYLTHATKEATQGPYTCITSHMQPRKQLTQGTYTCITCRCSHAAVTCMEATKWHADAITWHIYNYAVGGI
eukprot:1146478-Pelagomonas_calceolata.AAC.9